MNDHLGNIRALINDRKTYGGATFAATLLDATDYFPFGAEMRKGTVATSYRYGFNGKELDKNGEFGSLNHYDYGFRIYNPGIGRFLSVDPLTQKYPELTPYQFASNTPIWAIDLDGLEAYYLHGTSQSSKTAKGHKGLQRSLQFILENIATNKHKVQKVDISFDWGANAGPLNTASPNRKDAANSFADYVISTHVEGEPITLIGYSHGGNVAAQAAPIISKALGVEVNIISINTPTSRADEFTYSGSGASRAENPRYKENPENPNLSKSVNSWYHFYMNNDLIVGFSTILESSGLTYNSKFIDKEFKLDPKKITHKPARSFEVV